MATFSTNSELRACFSPLFEWARYQEKVGRRISERQVVFQWQYSDPEDTVTFDASKPSATPGAYFDVIWGATPIRLSAVLQMSADTAHGYFLNRVILPLAMANREITISRPTFVLDFLTCILPLKGQYPRVLAEIGRSDLLPEGGS